MSDERLEILLEQPGKEESGAAATALFCWTC